MRFTIRELLWITALVGMVTGQVWSAKQNSDRCLYNERLIHKVDQDIHKHLADLDYFRDKDGREIDSVGELGQRHANDILALQWELAELKKGKKSMGKPNQKQFLAAKGRLRKRLGKMLAQTEQLLADLQWWNQNRTDEKPFDVGAELVLIDLLKQALALVEAEKYLPDSLMERINQHVQARAQWYE